MSLVPLLLCGCLSLQGPPQAAIDPPAEFVLAATTELRVEALLLGDGGLAGATPAVLQCAAGSCRTPGGIVVEVKTAGVKLTFPSGRELLYTPSGWLHLRGGEAAGPYLAGLELLLADGARLRIDRTGSRREPLQEVLVTADGRSDRLWLQNRPVLETARPRSWSGQRLLCCGHGDAVYHGIALGPLLVFERVLVAAADAAVLPAARMALLVPPIVQSLQAMPVHLRGTGAADVRAGLVGLAEASAGIFAANMPAPTRVEQARPRFRLQGGFELSVDIDDSGPVRLGLHTGEAREPLLEWTLGYFGELHLMNQHADGQAETPRYFRSALRLPDVASELLPRAELRELEQARAMLQRLLGKRR